MKDLLSSTIDEKVRGDATLKDVESKEGMKDGFLVTTEHYFIGCHSRTSVISLKAENEKIQNGISKIAKKEKEIAILKEQVQNGVSMIGNL